MYLDPVNPSIMMLLDRCQFLSGEIACLYFDDWMVLSIDSGFCIAEHQLLWQYTH